ncbi:hypothetical protein ABW19_dt0201259 [Dactylella cylindrospora]|nr:hypothetical protein ABW19_dt0201259 [Dactylella cylindrospora]
MKVSAIILATLSIVATASAVPTAEPDITIKLSPELHKRLPEPELTELIKKAVLSSREPDAKLDARGWCCGFGYCGTTTSCCIRC